MTKPILSMCLAAVGFAGLLPATVSAHEAAAPAATQATLSLPDTARVNETVILEGGGHRYHRYHHRYYGHHRHYYYRHGHRYYR